MRNLLFFKILYYVLWRQCLVAQLCRILCDPTDHSLPGSSVRGTLQARILEWIAMPSSRGSSNPGSEPASLVSPALASRFFTPGSTWEALLISIFLIKKKKGYWFFFSDSEFKTLFKISLSSASSSHCLLPPSQDQVFDKKPFLPQCFSLSNLGTLPWASFSHIHTCTHTYTKTS